MPRRTLLVTGALATVFSWWTTGVSAPARQAPARPPASSAPAPAPTVAPARAQSSPNLAAPRPGALSPRNASYSIDVRLDPSTPSLSGSELLTWRNIAPVTTSELRFHLYYNAWKNTDSTWLRERLLANPRSDIASRPPGDWGWIEVTAVRLLSASGPPIDLTGQRRYVSPDDGNPNDQTVLAVPLPRAVAPGDTITVQVEWTSRIPRTFARTGAIGHYFFLGQWFPKLGVLEETGWNCHQFHAGTEFFADYGVYDVRMTVPKGWLVGATGRQQEVRDTADGFTTHRYFQEDVHDFAWTTSPDYLERRAQFDHTALPSVEMRLLLQPEHVDQAARHFTATRAALKYYGEWYGAYPYSHITIIDPAWQSGASGMEYPTLFTAGTRWLAPEGVTQPEGVTVHEAGHQFWYGIVGNNEFEHAWMDEGFNTFSTARVIAQAFSPNYHSQRFFGGFIPYVYRDIQLPRETDGNRLNSYRSAAKADAQATPSYLYWPATGARITYDKTALWLNTLERFLGWPTVQRIMSAHFNRWKFRHPKPRDFFEIANDASRRDLTWFFDQVHRSSNVFDYGVQQVTSTPVPGRGYFDSGGQPAFSAGVGGDESRAGRYRTTVVVRRYGEATFPVEVLIVFKNGERVRERWDGRERWRALSYERAARPASVQVDPNRVLLLDVNYTNNSWTADPKSAAASMKWALKWMVWLQDLMATYAFFV